MSGMERASLENLPFVDVSGVLTHCSLSLIVSPSSPVWACVTGTPSKACRGT